MVDFSLVVQLGANKDGGPSASVVANSIPFHILVLLEKPPKTPLDVLCALTALESRAEKMTVGLGQMQELRIAA